MATHLPTLKYADIFYGLRTEHLERISAICSELAPEQDTILFEENSPGISHYGVTGAFGISLEIAKDFGYRVPVFPFEQSLTEVYGFILLSQMLFDSFDPVFLW